ncbi:YcaO-like family protein [Planctomycetota bacterium]|nr:YcaO-like family protein [Planctomycetota bacterium]
MSHINTVQPSIKQDEERSVNAEQAIIIAQKDIEALNLRQETFTFGNTLPIYETRIFDQQNNLLARGTGKGIYPFNKAGAIFEAIEHLFGVSLPPSPHNLIPKTTSFLASQSITDQYIPFQLLQDFPDQQIYCTEFHCYDKPNQTLYLPTFLWSPHLCCSPEYYRSDDNLELSSVLLKYACNSGVASGLTPDDAILHGINEGIERDGHGRLLYKYFYNDPNPINPLPIIETSTLPAELLKEIRDIEHQLGDTCILINATSDLGIPVIGAIFKNYHLSHNIPAPGFGCSLFPEIAIRRAVYEAIQIMNGADYYPEQRREAYEEDLQRVQEHEAYTRCVTFNISAYEQYIGYEPQSFNRLYSHTITCAPISVHKQIKLLTEHLQAYNLNIYTHTLKQLKHNTIIISTQIPGLSLFYLTASGMMIPPTGRTSCL